MFHSIPIPYLSDATPYFTAIRGFPWAAWLDSGQQARYDILTAQPVATLVSRGAYTEIRSSAGTRRTSDDPFELVREELGEATALVPDVPFAGGALGYWGYDLARRWSHIPDIAQNAERLPEMAVGIYDWAIVVDHQMRQAALVSHRRYAETAGVLPKVLALVRSAPVAKPQPGTFSVHGRISSNLPPEAYRLAFERIQQYLHSGDCYQVNLAQRYAARASGDGFAAYLALRALSPAPFSAFLDWPQLQVLCASPERFLQVRERRVETRPIKGTRARSLDPAEDVRRMHELREHPKDRAENLMIVDLLRNDLGKHCLAGSVRVTGLFEVESYSNVHHLVSTVEGRLQAGGDALQVLRDCFPGGSITGAPKQRAMEIIEELEPHRRGVYCGSIGYVGYDGSMDSNIAIRTLVYSDGEIRCWAGGGIVADSRCEDEYQETQDKAVAMLALLRQFGGEME